MQVVTKDRQDLRGHQALKELLDLREQREPAATPEQVEPPDLRELPVLKVLLDPAEPLGLQVTKAQQGQVEHQAHKVLPDHQERPEQVATKAQPDRPEQVGARYSRSKWNCRSPRATKDPQDLQELQEHKV